MKHDLTALPQSAAGAQVGERQCTFGLAQGYWPPLLHAMAGERDGS